LHPFFRTRQYQGWYIFLESIFEFDQALISCKYTTLGTDGYGRSDARKALRDHFEVDSRYIVLATLSSLLDEGKIEQKVVLDAIKKYKINIDKTDPVKL
jgi:pyruvate dehydrogenase E1 component